MPVYSLGLRSVIQGQQSAQVLEAPPLGCPAGNNRQVSLVDP